MTEIGSIQESFYIDPPIEDEVPEWKKIGDIAFLGFSFIGTCAFLPACLKKKRIYIAQQGAAPAVVIPDVVEAPPVEAPVVAGPQPNPAVERFPRCSPEDAGRIREIFLTTQNMNTFYLWRILSEEKPRLEALGNALRANNVHPFEFLRCAPKEAVQAIFRSWNVFKTDGVMAGVIEGMNRESARNNLERYIPDFAATMGKSVEQLRPLIREHQWRRIVDYLFDI